MASTASVMRFVVIYQLLTLVKQSTAGDVKDAHVLENCYDVGHTRECFLHPLNWHTTYNWGQQFCMTWDSNLVNVNSQQMQTSVEDFAQYAKFREHNIVVGARRISSTQWTWNNAYIFQGSVLNESSDSIEFRVNAAVKLTSQKQINFIARKPTDKLNFICQYKVRSKLCAAENNERKPQIDDSVCYLPHTDEQLTWHEARNKCLLDGGDLAVFVDDKRHVIADMASSLPETQFWVGLRTTWWTWLNGEEMSYSNWSPGQPTGSSHFCVAMSKNHAWRWLTVDCADDKFVYVCQRDYCTDWWCVVAIPWKLVFINIIFMIVVITLINNRQTICRWYVLYRFIRRRFRRGRETP